MHKTSDDDLDAAAQEYPDQTANPAPAAEGAASLHDAKDEQDRPPVATGAAARAAAPADDREGHEAEDDEDDEFEWIQGWSAEYNVYYNFHVPTSTSSSPASGHRRTRDSREARV